MPAVVLEQRQERLDVLDPLEGPRFEIARRLAPETAARAPADTATSAVIASRLRVTAASPSEMPGPVIMSLLSRR